MFLFPHSFQAHSKTICGTQYVVFSHYAGDDIIFDQLGKMMEDTFTLADTVEITNASSLDSDIALQKG